MEPLIETVEAPVVAPTLTTPPIVNDGSVYYPAVVRIRSGALETLVAGLVEKGGFTRGSQPRIYVHEGKLLIEIPCNSGKMGSVEYVSIDISMNIP